MANVRLGGNNATLFRMIRSWEAKHEAYQQAKRDAEQRGEEFDEDSLPSGLDVATEPNEIMVEGPAGTGKTRAILECIYYLWSSYPNIRIAFARKTKTDVNKSILVEWEQEVLGPGHPSLADGTSLRGRQTYTHPHTGSVVEAWGYDDVQRWRSTQFDVLYVNEGTELTLEDWELSTNRVRNHKLPFGNFSIMDTNPDGPHHWANQRPKEKHKEYPARAKMTRIVTRHEDNPKYYDRRKKRYTKVGRDYIFGTLEAMTGVRYLRFRKGVWAAAEGLIYGTFDPARHTFDDAGLIPKSFKYTFGAMDFGWRDAGVLGVWGVDGYDRMWLLHEVYRTEVTTPQWAKWAKSAYDDWSCIGFVVPHDRPENAQLLRQEGMPVVRCQMHTVDVGIDIVREKLAFKADGKPGLMFWSGASVGPDAKLIEARKPTCTIDEFPSYVYPEAKDGKPLKEKPLEGLDDHGMDMTRYACVFNARMGPSAFDGERVSTEKTKSTEEHEDTWRTNMRNRGWQLE